MLKSTKIKLKTSDGKILEIISKQGEQGIPGPQGEKGETVVGPQGEKGDSVQGPQGPKGDKGDTIVGPAGSAGKDGSPDTPTQIAEKLNTLEKEVDFKVLKNIPKNFGTGGTGVLHRGGETTFTGLTDTPNTYTGQGDKIVKVNAGGTALEFDTLASIAGATFLEEANNLSDLDDVATARTNLGLIAGGAGDIWVEKAGDTMTGALTLANLTNALNSGAYGLKMLTGHLDAGDLMDAGYVFDSTSLLLTDYLATFRSLGVDKFSITGMGGARILSANEADYVLIGAAADSLVAVTGGVDRLASTISSTTGSCRAGVFSSQYKGTSGGSFVFQGLNAFAATASTALGNLTSTTLGGSLRNRYSINHNAASTVVEASSVSTNCSTNSASSLITTYQAFNVEPGIVVNGAITNFYGLRMRNLAGAGAITQLYGVYIEALTRGTNSYGIVTNSTTPNSLGGSLSVGFGATGHTLPTARLHIAAGTTAASTAPLKFTSGALQTTAEAGGMEFLTDDLFFTQTTGAKRKTIEFQENYSQSFLLMGA